jgi:hypothetical protein
VYFARRTSDTAFRRTKDRRGGAVAATVAPESAETPRDHHEMRCRRALLPSKAPAPHRGARFARDHAARPSVADRRPVATRTSLASALARPPSQSGRRYREGDQSPRQDVNRCTDSSLKASDTETSVLPSRPLVHHRAASARRFAAFTN